MVILPEYPSSPLPLPDAPPTPVTEVVVIVIAVALPLRPGAWLSRSSFESATRPAGSRHQGNIMQPSWRCLEVSLESRGAYRYAGPWSLRSDRL